MEQLRHGASALVLSEIGSGGSGSSLPAGTSQHFAGDLESTQNGIAEEIFLDSQNILVALNSGKIE
jgi:hypothetical protein